PDLVIDELILAYVEFARRYYVKNGLPTGETVNIKYSLKPLSELFGKTRVNDFGPIAMKATRKRMIEGKLCRSVINSRLNRIRRMFKWAVETRWLHLWSCNRCRRWLRSSGAGARPANLRVCTRL